MCVAPSASGPLLPTSSASGKASGARAVRAVCGSTSASSSLRLSVPATRSVCFFFAGGGQSTLQEISLEPRAAPAAPAVARTSPLRPALHQKNEPKPKRTKRETKRRERKSAESPKPWPRPPRSHVPLSRAGRLAEGQRSTEGHTVSLSQRALSPPSWPWGSPSPRASHRQPRDSPLPAPKSGIASGPLHQLGRCKLEPTLSSL